MAEKTGNSKKRKKLGESKKLVLAVESGGMCNFPGCRQVMIHQYEDGTCITNLVEHCHIIGHQCTGPRGHPTESALNATDPNNIILLCDKDHKIVDGNTSLYTVEKLLKMKEDHVKWWKDRTSNNTPARTLITSAGNLNNTGIIPLDADLIKSQLKGTYDIAEVYSLDVGEYLTKTNNWAKYKAAQESWWAAYQKRRNKFPSFVVCAINYIPLVIHLGTLLRSSPVEVFHSRVNTWMWDPLPDASTQTPFFHEEPLDAKDANVEEIALSISISGKVDDTSIFETTGKQLQIWKICVDNPGRDWFHYKEQLTEFTEVITRTFDSLVLRFKPLKGVHLFYAGPTPPALMLGYKLRASMHPKLVLYNYSMKTNPIYTRCFEVE